MKKEKKRKRINRKRAKQLENRIKRKLRKHLRDLGYRTKRDGTFLPPRESKRAVRSLHFNQKKALIRDETKFLNENFDRLFHFFASGTDVIPQKIKPRIELIGSDCWQSDLFRLAGLTWSVPVSKGYGRRLRFLVWDDYNGKLIGIFALGDPVFNSRVRDDFIGWNPEQRIKKLVNCMDAYVLGAVPPYNFLLGGKLVSCLIKTKEVRRAFLQKYGKTKGIISGKRKKASLSLVTTSSALGKSSVYNRLKLNGQKYFDRIGYTEGWGHFHISNGLFEDIRTYLQVIGHPYASGHQFGSGPNWRMRAVRAAFESMGISGDILRHGIGREVFVCPFIKNLSSYLKGNSKNPIGDNVLSVKQVSELALERWIVPRSHRVPDYLFWKREHISKLIYSEKATPTILRKPRKTGISRAIQITYKGLDRETKALLRQNVRKLPRGTVYLVNRRK